MGESPLLFNERVVAVQPSLVRAVGSMTGAAVLQQIHYHSQAGDTSPFEGHEWVVRTYAELGSEIGLSEDQVRRAVVKQEAAGLIETCQPEGHVRTKWYRVVTEHAALSESSNRQNRGLEPAGSRDATGDSAASSSLHTAKRRDRSQPSVEGFASLQPVRCERECWSGWLMDEDGNKVRCSCAA